MDTKTRNLVLTIVLAILILATIAVLAFLGKGYYEKANHKVENPRVTMKVEGFGSMVFELYPDLAPNTVANFIKLSENGFYNGLTFHRIMSTFMIQGGDPNGDGSGGPSLSDLYKETKEEDDKEYAIEGEFAANDHMENNMKLSKGVIAMARSDYSSISPSLLKQGYNSAGSQFFIMTTEEETGIDGMYAGFGKIVECYDVDGNKLENKYEVLDKIAAVEVKAAEEGGEQSTPVTPPVIESITVDTHEIDYGYPETHDPFDYYNYIMSQYSSSVTSSTVEPGE